MTAVDPIVVEVTEAPISVTVASTGLVLSVASGTVGPAGAQGPAGTNGQGVPTGGTTGQVLAKKTGTNYDTEWVDQSGGGGGGSGTVTEVTGTAPISVATGTTTPVVSIAAATTSAAGSMSAADKTKLDGVEAGATANATNAQLRDRSTHTGTQTLSTISDAGTAAAKNAPATGNAAAGEVVLGSDTRLTDARTPSSTLSHASTHGAAGSDPVTLAQSQVTNLTTDLAGKVPTTRTVNGQALSADVVITTTTLGAVSTGDASVTNARVPQWRRLTFSNADYDLSATPSPAVSGSVVLQQTGTVSAPRTVTLPAASACPAGSEVVVNGGAGVTATNTVSIARSGSDTINGATSSVVIGTAWGQRRFVSDGVSAWAYDDGLVRRSQNLSDLASASTARTNLGLAAIASSGSASDLSTGTVPTARLNTLVVGGQGAGSQVNEPSVATSLLTSTVTIPACAAGDVILFSAGINLTQNSSVSRSVTFAVKLGATTILSSIPSITSSATARVMHLQGAIRVGSTTAQSASMILSFSTSASGSTGVVNAATGTATENLASASTLDLLVTATNNATQNYTLSYLNVTKVAA